RCQLDRGRCVAAVALPSFGDGHRSRRTRVAVVTATPEVRCGYDRATETFNTFRAAAVDLLGLTPGQVVLDVGCGTGLCFSYLQQRIGPSGTIIGIDRSAEMLAYADLRHSSSPQNLYTK